MFSGALSSSMRMVVQPHCLQVGFMVSDFFGHLCRSGRRYVSASNSKVAGIETGSLQSAQPIEASGAVGISQSQSLQRSLKPT